MQIKKGGIYKVKGKGRGYFHSNIDDHVVVVVDIDEENQVVSMMNEHIPYTEAYLSEAKFSSTRIQPELRRGLKELYQIYTKEKKVEEEIKKLQSEKYELFDQLKRKSQELLKYSPIISVKSVEEIMNSEWFYTKDNDNSIVIGVGINIYLEKYANPEKFSFLDREYDNTIYIYDHERAVKECKINIDHLKNEVNKIKSLANNKRVCKLTGIKDDVYHNSARILPLL